MARGKFITLEGPEGAGKSTHLARLAEALRARGIEVLTTREPGGTPLCEAVRGLLQFNQAGEAPQTRAEVLLFLASRAQLVSQVIEPALARGTWVLCDRFCDSTFAYQGYGRGLELAQLRALNAFATGGLMPDLTLLLDIPEAESARRLAERKGPADRFEQEQAAFHRRLAEGFREMAAAEPTRFRVIDSSGSEAQTAAQILAAVESFT
ncbi:MAG: dTMP kinase [Candidatus Spyradenecus sp.]